MNLWFAEREARAFVIKKHFREIHFSYKWKATNCFLDLTKKREKYTEYQYNKSNSGISRANDCRGNINRARFAVTRQYKLVIVCVYETTVARVKHKIFWWKKIFKKKRQRKIIASE